jgi:hypothetical protein
MSDTGASYVTSDEQGARKKVLDNRQSIRLSKTA